MTRDPALLKATFEQVAVGIAHIGLDGRIQQANPKLAQLLGRPAALLVGQPLADFSHAEDRDEAIAAYAAILHAELDRAAFEKRYLRPDGETVWLRVSVSLARDAAGAPQFEVAAFEDVTAQRRSLAELRRFRNALDLSGEAVFIVSRRTMSIVDVNEAACRDLGYERDELVGAGPEIVLEPGTVTRADIEKIYDRLIDSPGAGSVQRTHRRKDGSTFPVEIQRSSMVVDGERYVVAVARNITARRREELLLQMEHDIGRCLAEAQSVSGGLRDALAILCRAKGWEAARYFGVDERQSMLRCEASWSIADPKYAAFNEASSSLTFNRGAGLGGIVWATGEPVWVPDVTKDPRVTNGALVQSGIRSAFVFPVLAEGGLTGIVATFSRAVREPDERLLRATRSIGRQIGQFVQRKRAQEELEQERHKLRLVLDNMPAFVALFTPRGRFLEVNDAPLHYLGKRREELLGQAFAEGDWWRHSESMHERVRAAIARAAAGEVVREDLTVSGASGEIRAFDMLLAPLLDGAGAVTQIVATGIDVTDRKAAEDRVAALNRVHAVLSGINTLIVRVKGREELFHGACRIAIEEGGFRMAWIGLLDAEHSVVRPVASAGAVGDFFESAPLAVTAAAPGGHGLAGRAVRELRPVVSNDVRSDPQRLMRRELETRGINSLAVLPLIVGGQAAGVLALYAGEAGAFDAREMQLLEELAGDIAFAIEHIQKSEKVDYLAYYDALTGLANRALMQERLAEELRALDAGRKLSLLVLNIDRFKDINDAYGRRSGDRVLRKVAQRLTDALGDRTRLSRTGADTFAVLVPDRASEEETARLAERLLAAVFDRPIGLSDGEVRITGKVGIAVSPADATDGDTLFHQAEAAMKRAKAQCQRYLFYTSAMTERTAAKLSLEARLRRALDNEEFVLHYQPKVAVATGALTGLEALIRWQNPELGLVPPKDFIPLMEETGLIVEAGAWAIRRAALDHRAWTERGLKPPRVAVNVSPLQLRQHDFIRRVEGCLLEGVAPVGIDVEITESLLMADVAMSGEKLARLRELGVRIAIDDFGTGYSSLAYLARLPVQTLKIDRSFIIQMGEDADTMSLVQTIISLAHSLRLTVIAEGVDAQEQARYLRLLRCDEMQGYLISRPVPFEQVAARLAQPAEMHAA
ncbi:MAG TPA: EAL domain-containing protein [Burkholderiales bacterium]|nr:EAL domain-containing protein [Burkholderiales bacterium]